LDAAASFSTGQMLFLSPNKQRQSIEGNKTNSHTNNLVLETFTELSIKFQLLTRTLVVMYTGSGKPRSPHTTNSKQHMNYFKQDRITRI